MYSLKLSPENISGVEILDSDHRILFEICNELFETQQKFGAHAEVDSLLNRLLAHLEEHFKREEELQRINDYPSIEAHSEEHRTLLEHTRDLIKRHYHELLSFGDLYKFIVFEVVKGHLESADSKFHKFLQV